MLSSQEWLAEVVSFNNLRRLGCNGGMEDVLIILGMHVQSWELFT
jgi:hypothetical protein